MTPYTPERIPPKIVSDKLKDNWNDWEDNIPLPEIVDVNEDLETAIARYNLQDSDLVIIRTDTGGIRETWRDAHKYADELVNIEIVIFTMKDRQRLYDLMQEIRRIFRTYKHFFGTYHEAIYLSFVELTQQQLNIWNGIIRTQLDERRIYIGGE